MATDPKNDELREEELENVSGGDKTPDPHETPWAPPSSGRDDQTAQKTD